MKRITIYLCFLFLSSAAIAQTGGGSFMLGYPQGDFRKNVDQMGYGFQLHGTLWTPSDERPVTIGLNLGYLVYGSVSERREWPGFPGIFLDLNRTNSLGNLHVLIQVSPFMGTIKPYVEALFGGSYIFTTSEVKSQGNIQNIASSTNFDDFTWNYGGGAGILFKVAEGSGEIKAWYLDIKARYLFGTEAEYLTEESIYVINNKTVYNPRKSKTDFFTFHVGAVAYF